MLSSSLALYPCCRKTSPGGWPVTQLLRWLNAVQAVFSQSVMMACGGFEAEGADGFLKNSGFEGWEVRRHSTRRGISLSSGPEWATAATSQRFSNILRVCILFFFFLLPLFIYVFIYSYIYIYLLHSSQTQSKAKKYIYMYICCRQNTVNFTTATKQLFCHLNIRLRRRNGKT